MVLREDFCLLPPEEENAICMVKCGSVIALHFQRRTLPQIETDTISSPGMQKRGDNDGTCACICFACSGNTK